MTSHRLDSVPLVTAASCARARRPYSGRYLRTSISNTSKNGPNTREVRHGERLTYRRRAEAQEPGVLRQSRISSSATANIDSSCTPAARMRSLASSAVFTSNVPDASLFANTVYSASTSERARKDVQTSVVMPARMTCVLPVASTALRKSALSHAFTSPLRLNKAGSGCMSMISCRSGSFSPGYARTPWSRTASSTCSGPGPDVTHAYQTVRRPSEHL
ncbi:hypothetical protein OH76DRAFT_1007844 [Lentinus brumalis]|uniref:Uncharacterized protein n=1 Tax=Lentinus brumalis TaxID=2498619 RepID=A0A371CY98_9APHY|nr:hypothetical protein OH76DRAFT_1007844 [Polyporus brumalis]